ncbi:MAG: hypothetical protein IJI84_01760 [Clostridia bacterium]|nr:hypothetical protein [Clostridia bacterium]
MNKKISKLSFLIIFVLTFFGALNFAFGEKAYAVDFLKSTPIISKYPTASEIHVGQALSESTLSGGYADVPGTIKWKNPGYVPALGINSCTAIFTPNDSNHYKSVEFNVNVTVTKWNLKIYTSPKASEIHLGQSISESTLAGGNAVVNVQYGHSVPGTFSWQNPDFIPSTVGSHDCAVVFTPADLNTYEPLVFNISVYVRNILITNPKASSITYGEPLSKSVLSDGWACVPGTFYWENPNLLLNAGTHTCTATFTPNDLNKFKKINFSVTVKVKKAPVTIYTFPQATPLVYGQKLSESQIYNLCANVPGFTDWKYPLEKYDVLSAGKHYRWITFTPRDTDNYEPFSYKVEVTVYKAPPSPPSKKSFSATYKPNMRLSDFQLPDGWEWKNPNTLIDFTGNRKFKIYRVETDNYLAAKDYATVDITKASPKLELDDITYSENQHLYDIKLPKGWSWNDPQKTPTVDTEYYKATFNPDKSDNRFYRFDNNVSVKMKVLKASPTITKWIEPSSDYVYGTDINSIAKAPGKASVSGNFYWDKLEDDLKIGKNKIYIKFVPDNSNYLTVYDSSFVNVIKNNTPESPPKNPNNKIIITDVSILFEKKDEIDALEYSKDGGKTWQASAAFYNLTPNTTYKFIYRYKNTELRCAGKNSSEITVKTKSSAPEAPEKVEIIKKTNCTVTLKYVPGQEYSKDGGKTWQDSPEFYNLNENTTYSFVTRIKETDEHMPSFISEENKIKTKSLSKKIPEELEIIKKTNHEIIFKGNSGQEYSKDGGKTWQDSPEFKNLEGSTTYNFATRFKETEEYVPSQSITKDVKTLSWFKNVFWNKFIGIFTNVSWKE